MFEYTNGFRKAIYWSKKKMESHAEKYSQGYKAKKGFTFWEKDFDSMAYKTMLRQLISKWGILSTEMQTAFESDDAVINEDGSKTYVETEEAPVLEAPKKEEAPADPNETTNVAEEIINRAEAKEEAQKKSKKKTPEPADASAALFG